jgi:hypothetical protein
VKTGDLIASAKVVRMKRNAIDLLVNDRERTIVIAETKEVPKVPPMPGVTPVPAASPGTTIVSRSILDEGLQDMGSLLRQARIQSYFDAGGPGGFTISNIRMDSLYKKMGIVDRDIIQEVTNIQTTDDVMMLLNSMRAGSSMSGTV